MTTATAPLVSLVATTLGDQADLQRTLDSLRAQTDPGWELWLPDGAVPAHTDARVRLVETGRALPPVDGDFLAFVDPGGALDPDAVSILRGLLAEHPEVDLCYTDEAVVTEAGEVVDKWLKPGWSPERLRGQCYTGRLTLLRTSVLRRVAEHTDPSPVPIEHDLVLRVSEVAREVRRVPSVLYRRSDPCPPMDEASWEAGARTVRAHLERTGVPATVARGPAPGTYRINRVLDPTLAISVVIPTEGAKGLVRGEGRRYVVEAVRSLLRNAGQHRLEIVVMYNTGTPPAVLDEMRDLSPLLHLRGYAGRFNFSRMCNHGVVATAGDVVVLLDERTEVTSPDFLPQLVAPLLDVGVGMTGPRLVATNGTVTGAGVAIHHNMSEPLFAGHLETEAGPGSSLAVSREVSGLSPACLAMRREVYEMVGGLNERLPLLGHVDLACKLAALGLRRVWVAEARLLDVAPAYREHRRPRSERRLLSSRWQTDDSDSYVPSHGSGRRRRSADPDAVATGGAQRTPLV